MEENKDIKMEENKLDTTNPFNPGVTYEMFLKNVNGKTKVEHLLKKHNCTKDQIEFIERELENIKERK